jgi:hypothetical protein
MLKKNLLIILVIAVTYGIVCICLFWLIHWEGSHLIHVILVFLWIPWIQYVSSRTSFYFTEVLNLSRNFSNSMNSMNFPSILSKDYLKAFYHTGDIQTLCNSSTFMNLWICQLEWCNSLDSLNLWVMMDNSYCLRRRYS